MVNRLRRWLLSRVADPAWQSRASVGWLSRLIARRQARELFELCTGFARTQTLLACERLALFEQIQHHPVSLAELAQSTSVPELRLERLLDAAVALELFERTAAGFRLGLRGAAVLGNPGVRAMIRHHEMVYRDLADPVALLRNGAQSAALGRYWSYADGDSSSVVAADAYSQLMGLSQSFIAAQALAVLPRSEPERLVDLGGGHGVFASAAKARYPAAEVCVLDLPAVVKSAPATDGVTFLAGDLFDGPLPAADSYSLVRILHDHDTDAVERLLRRVRGALAGGGQLFIIEPMAGSGARRANRVYFDWYFLAMGQGRLRSAEELTRLLNAAGFDAVERPSTPVPLLTDVLIARVHGSN
ncbi:MAG: methyltransferase [Pseudomonadota bacterium]